MSNEFFESFIRHTLNTYPTYEERAKVFRENGFELVGTIENLSSKDRTWAYHGNWPFVKDSILKSGGK